MLPSLFGQFRPVFGPFFDLCEKELRQLASTRPVGFASGNRRNCPKFVENKCAGAYVTVIHSIQYWETISHVVGLVPLLDIRNLAS